MRGAYVPHFSPSPYFPGGHSSLETLPIFKGHLDKKFPILEIPPLKI